MRGERRGGDVQQGSLAGKNNKKLVQWDNMVNKPIVKSSCLIII